MSISRAKGLTEEVLTLRSQKFVFLTYKASKKKKTNLNNMYYFIYRSFQQCTATDVITVINNGMEAM